MTEALTGQSAALAWRNGTTQRMKGPTIHGIKITVLTIF
jgi:hypothetical protein